MSKNSDSSKTPPKMSTRIVEENLDVQLNDEQKTAIARELAETVTRIALCEEDKKSTAAVYSGQLKEERAEEKRLAGKITTGKHRVPVSVEIAYHYKKKRVIKTRLDTKEVIENRPLLAEEKQMPLE